MRRLLLLATILLVALVALYRQRLFLRDPIAKVQRNDRPVTGALVFLNYSNDILLQERDGTRMTVVQNWNRTPATPRGLTCIQGMLCLTPADRVVELEAATPPASAQMSNREVVFTEADGARVHVTLR